MSDHQSGIAGGLSQALALRYLYMARHIAHTAKEHGHEMPEADVLPDFNDMRRRYQELTEEWLAETAHSCRDASALAEFAVAVLADKPVLLAMSESSPLGDDADQQHAIVALGTLCQWINAKAIAEIAAEHRAKRGTVVV